MLVRMERAESQGHRLSSYASSSSTRHSPKTPKKSSEKLSAHSSFKEESLSPHHLLSGYSHTSINSQSKDQNLECVLKCTCSNSNYNSLKSSRSNCGNDLEKGNKLAKVSCDAATSPGRFSQNSPQHQSTRWFNQKSSTVSNELRLNDEKKLTSKPNPSPRRLVATRNAATSPNLDMRKLSPKQCEVVIKSPKTLAKTSLEKSNSLGDNKPNRQLRTTRSLSPRPPVRHQHAIMVSDENDIVSVKVSPNEDFDIDAEEKKAIEHISKINSINCGTVKKHKAQSEQTSPNLGDFDASFSYEKSTNNKSISCLVYVPSDPWLKMSDFDKKEMRKSDESARKKFARFSQETRSLSRGNLLPFDNNDPWIWRKPSNDNLSPKNNTKRSPKQEMFRQTKSFSATKFEISDSGKIVSLSLKDADSSNKTSANRPKLQRCKSPIIIDDDLPSISFTKDTRNISCTCNNDPSSDSSNQNMSSPRKDLNLTDKSTTNLTIQQNKSFLHVMNPNAMLTRHSFSSISQKDDELQLNIRRLSEQIKNSNQASGADFTDYLNQFKYNEAKKAKTMNATKNDADPVLETTC